MNLIACAHPGKIGDALYALPTVRALCEKHGAKCDFFTSDYCLPMKDLVEAQSYIRQMVVPAGYVIRSMDCGVQPGNMPIDPTGYEAVYQMGFQGCPSGFIAEYIAEKAGLPREAGREVSYQVPWHELWTQYPGGYVVVCSRGETSYAERLREMVKRCRLPCIEVGAPGQAVCGGVDKTGRSMLEMASIIGGAEAFVGLMSAPLVIANGFTETRKIVPHDGKSWDMSHVMYSPLHHYLVEPTVEQLLELI